MLMIILEITLKQVIYFTVTNYCNFCSFKNPEKLRLRHSLFALFVLKMEGVIPSAHTALTSYFFIPD